MRRTTAAAVGTITGAALILGVRLSAAATPVAAPPPAFDLSEGEAAANAGGKPPASRGGRPVQGDDRDSDDERSRDGDGPARESDEEESAEQESANALSDGEYTGRPVSNPYGTVQVAVRIRDGRVTSAAATYPTSGQSATINADAIPKLKKETLSAQSAEIDAVSGATYTSEAYIESLQAALDAAAR